MTQPFSAIELRDAMEEISRLNLEIQREHLPYKPYERALSKCGCSFRSRNEDVYDKCHAELPSNHLRMTDYARKAARNAAILALHDRLMGMSCLFPDRSRILLSFDLTVAGNSAIDIRIDGISVHDRPVTARTLAPKIVELAECLARSAEREDEDRPVRRFIISHTDRMTAVSPGQAMWKWICLKHRKEALRMLAEPVGKDLPDHPAFVKLMHGTSVHEVFDAAPQLAGALGLRCPGALIKEKDGLW